MTDKKTSAYFTAIVLKKETIFSSFKSRNETIFNPPFLKCLDVVASVSFPPQEGPISCLLAFNGCQARIYFPYKTESLLILAYLSYDLYSGGSLCLM